MQTFNPVISFVRVISMLIVIITHFLAWKNINSYQISTIGVAAFLFISGYLYGIKKIDNGILWLKQRVKRVLVPFWILASILSLYLVAVGNYTFAIRQFIESLFNLQGLHSIFHFPFSLGYGHLSGLSHCWFLTIIVLCYLLVILLKRKKVELFLDKYPIVFLTMLICLHFALSFINVSIGCFVVFFVGYCYRRFEKSNIISLRNIFISSFIVLIAVACRIVLRHFVDGSCFYDYFIAPFSSNICAIWFFILVKWICGCFCGFNNFFMTNFWKKIDLMTFPLYLTHYMFLKNPFDLHYFCFISQNNCFFMELLVFSLVSCFSALILNLITLQLNRIIK